MKAGRILLMTSKHPSYMLTSRMKPTHGLEPVQNMFSLGKSSGNHDKSTDLPGAMWQLFGTLESRVPIDVIAMATIHYCNQLLMPVYI